MCTLSIIDTVSRAREGMPEEGGWVYSVSGIRGDKTAGTWRGMQIFAVL